MGLTTCIPILLGVLSLIQPSIDLPALNKRVTIETRVYRIPAFQSFMIFSGLGEKGSIIGNMYGGNVTATHPEGISIIRTASSKSEDEALQLIKEEISSYPCSCGDSVQIIPIDRHVISADLRTMNRTLFEWHDMIPGRRSHAGEYWFSVQLKGVEHQKTMINFRGDVVYWCSLIINEVVV